MKVKNKDGYITIVIIIIFFSILSILMYSLSIQRDTFNIEKSGYDFDRKEMSSTIVDSIIKVEVYRIIERCIDLSESKKDFNKNISDLLRIQNNKYVVDGKTVKIEDVIIKNEGKHIVKVVLNILYTDEEGYCIPSVKVVTVENPYEYYGDFDEDNINVKEIVHINDFTD